MEAIEIKKKLIEKISLSNNGALLEEIYRFLEGDDQTAFYQLTETEKQAVAEAREQLARGQIFGDDQVNDEIDEWLNGK